MTTTDIKKFDYIKVGETEAAMSRAYYNHHFFKLFVQLLLLIRRQLGLNWLITIQLAYYSAWAAADYRTHKHKGVNNARVLKNIRRFCQIVSDHNAEPFDYNSVAKYELEWWDTHRKSHQNSPALEHALARTTATMYGISPDKLQNYAHYRAEAMILPRHEGDMQAVPTDWQKVSELLIASWQELHSALQR